MTTPEGIRQRIDSIWAGLLAGGRQGHGFDAQRIDPTLPLACYAGVRNADGAPCILIDPVDPAIDHASISFEAAGLRVYVRRQPGAGTSLVLALEDASSRSLFAHLAADVVHAAALETDPGLCLRVFVQRLRGWQAFLRRAGGLSEPEVLGLIGELTILEGLASSWGWRKAVAAWIGPGGAAHDFERAGRALEVKATLGSGSRLEISNLGQLDSTGLDDLFVVLSVHRRDDEGESLPGLVGRLRRLAAESDLVARLDGLLLQAGYSPSQADRYVQTVLKLSSLRVYRVTGDFPRLLVSTVPSGIAAASYAVDTARIGRFVIEGVDRPDATANLFGAAR